MWICIMPHLEAVPPSDGVLLHPGDVDAQPVLHAAPDHQAQVVRRGQVQIHLRNSKQEPCHLTCLIMVIFRHLYFRCAVL